MESGYIYSNEQSEFFRLIGDKIKAKAKKKRKNGDETSSRASRDSTSSPRPGSTATFKSAKSNVTDSSTTATNALVEMGLLSPTKAVPTPSRMRSGKGPTSKPDPDSTATPPAPSTPPPTTPTTPLPTTPEPRPAQRTITDFFTRPPPPPPPGPTAPKVSTGEPAQKTIDHFFPARSKDVATDKNKTLELLLTLDGDRPTSPTTSIIPTPTRLYPFPPSSSVITTVPPPPGLRSPPPRPRRPDDGTIPRVDASRPRQQMGEYMSPSTMMRQLSRVQAGRLQAAGRGQGSGMEGDTRAWEQVWSEGPLARAKSPLAWDADEEAWNGGVDVEDLARWYQVYGGLEEGVSRELPVGGVGSDGGGGAVVGSAGGLLVREMGNKAKRE